MKIHSEHDVRQKLSDAPGMPDNILIHGALDQQDRRQFRLVVYLARTSDLAGSRGIWCSVKRACE